MPSVRFPLQITANAFVMAVYPIHRNNGYTEQCSEKSFLLIAQTNSRTQNM